MLDQVVEREQKTLAAIVRGFVEGKARAEEQIRDIARGEQQALLHLPIFRAVFLAFQNDAKALFHIRDHLQILPTGARDVAGAAHREGDGFPLLGQGRERQRT